MDIWSLGKLSRPLPESLTSVSGIGSFYRVTINGESSSPYLDIKLSWNKDNCLNFNVHMKPNELVKYLNTHSHHHCHHKSAVLSGVELQLALLTTMTPENANLSISIIYPDKHEALQTAGQPKPRIQEMQTLWAVLEDKSWSGPLLLEEKSRQTDFHHTFFITKYAYLGSTSRPINQVIKIAEDPLQPEMAPPMRSFQQTHEPRQKITWQPETKTPNWSCWHWPWPMALQLPSKV